MQIGNATTATLRTPFALGLTLIAAALGASPAAAQEAKSRDNGYFAPKLLLGLGGKADFEVDTAAGSFSSDYDLELSYGVGLAYVKPIIRYFAIGGQLGFHSWITDVASDNDNDRNLLFDLAVLPEGRLPVADDIELYLAIPIGLAYDIYGEDTGFSAGGGAVAAQVDVNNALGYTLGALVGARFGLSDSIGLLVELGYQVHAFSHEVEGGASAVGAMLGGSYDVDVSLGQFQLNVGVFFD